MNITKAIHINTSVVVDPDSKCDVEIEVYKDPVAGSIFAVDSSFIEQVGVYVPGIFNSGTLQLDDDDELEMRDPREFPMSTWAGQNPATKLPATDSPVR